MRDDLINIIKKSKSGNTISRFEIVKELSNHPQSIKPVLAFLESCQDLELTVESITAYDSEKLITRALNSDLLVDSTNEISTDGKYKDIDIRNDPYAVKLIKTSSYKDLEELIDPSLPINIYISGSAGLGKTVSIMHLAKAINKPVIRVNLSASTDIDDLLGGLRIVDGNTIFEPGPVAIAMEMGAILLLDEVDAGRPQVLLDLHPVLELRGVLAKKARRMIYPKPGFQVIASGNTKGGGDYSGKYIGVNMLNEAFLSRFDAWISWTPPSHTEVAAMISSEYPLLKSSVRQSLANFYRILLENYNNGTSEEFIEPRKILSIAKLNMIYKSKSGDSVEAKKALRKALGKLSESDLAAMLLVYDTVAVSEADDAEVVVFNEPPAIDETGAKIPF